MCMTAHSEVFFLVGRDPESLSTIERQMIERVSPNPTIYRIDQGGLSEAYRTPNSVIVLPMSEDDRARITWGDPFNALKVWYVNLGLGVLLIPVDLKN